RESPRGGRRRGLSGDGWWGSGGVGRLSVLGFERSVLGDQLGAAPGLDLGPRDRDLLPDRVALLVAADRDLNAGTERVPGGQLGQVRVGVRRGGPVDLEIGRASCRERV